MLKNEEDLGDEAAENSMEALVQFNEDMKVLALNTFQINELMDYAMLENDTMVKWLTDLEEETLRAEDDLVKMVNNLDVAQRMLHQI